MKMILVLITIISLVVMSCQKSAFREDELLERRNAIESSDPALLMSSIIQKSAYLYQNKGGMGHGTSPPPCSTYKAIAAAMTTLTLASVCPGPISTNTPL